MKITVLDGHPDRKPEHFCHALAATYAEGARSGGHEVRVIRLAELDFTFVRSPDEWTKGALPSSLADAQAAMKWADHLVIIYPMWLGDVPAYLKAFLEQVARPGFAFQLAGGAMKPGTLKGKSARIIVTMGMPAIVYRWFFFKHSLTSLKRNILEFVGVRPVRETIIGSIETADHRKWLERIRGLGVRGS